MINELFGQAIYNFIIGILLGIINKWKPKILFVFLIIAIIFFIILVTITGPENIYSDTYPWWMAIYGLFFMMIGWSVGDNIK